MIGSRNRVSPLVVAILFYAVLLGIALVRIYAITQGQQMYLLDDTYIHLSIVKNLLLHGVYGLSPVEPAMASSSILWPFLLVAVAKVFGLHILLPMVLNILFAIGLLALALHILHRSGINSWAWQTGTLMLLVMAFPLVAMTLDGMEHILYGAVFLLFLWLISTTLGEEHREGKLHGAGLILCAALLTSCRYEGVFAVFIAWLLLVRRRFLLAMAMGVAGALPVLLFGLFSRAHGGMWVPNSLVMKTSGLAFYQRALAIPRQMREFYLWECGALLLILLLVWIAFRTWRGGLTATTRAMLLLFLGTALLHLQFARMIDGTPRYESYLIGGGILLAVLSLLPMQAAMAASGQRFPLIGKVLIVLVLVPLIGYRGIRWEIDAPNAAKGIYLQQYQAARFFSRYYHDQPIAANDVGVVSYNAGVSCLDLWGLATNKIAVYKSTGTMSTAIMRRMAAERNIQVGFLYAQAFTGPEALPAEWVDVETWTIPLDPGYTVANATIHLYATSQQSAETLRAQLNEFRSGLPAGVTARTPDGRLLN